MRKELPSRPNLEHLKAQAKDLLDAYRRGEAGALQRFRESLPAASGADDAKLAGMKLALHDAQSVVAREYGFSSFAEMKAHVERTPDPEALRALMRVPLPAEVHEALVTAASRPVGDVPPLDVPLPLLPLRNALLPVGAVAPLSVARRSSLAAIDAAKRGTNVLAIFSQKDEASDDPGVADLHPVGCAARLIASMPGPEGSLWIVVRALAWIRLDSIGSAGLHPSANVSPFWVDDTEPSNDLHERLRERALALAANLPNAEAIVRRVESAGPLELADMVVANAAASVADKARYAEETSLVTRLRLALGMLGDR